MSTDVPAVPATFFHKFVENETSEINRARRRAAGVSDKSITERGIGIADTLHAAHARWSALKSLAADPRFANWFIGNTVNSELIEVAATHPLCGATFDAGTLMAALHRKEKNQAD